MGRRWPDHLCVVADILPVSGLTDIRKDPRNIVLFFAAKGIDHSGIGKVAGCSHPKVLSFVVGVMGMLKCLFGSKQVCPCQCVSLESNGPVQRRDTEFRAVSVVGLKD